MLKEILLSPGIFDRWLFLPGANSIFHSTISRSASLAGDVAAVDGFFTRFNVDPVAGFHLINGTAGVVMKLAGVAVSDIGERGGTN